MWEVSDTVYVLVKCLNGEEGFVFWESREGDVRGVASGRLVFKKETLFDWDHCHVG